MLFPLRRINPGPPVKGSFRLPCQPDLPRMLRKQIHLLESLGHRKSPRPVAHNHHVIRLLHHRLGQPRNVFDPPHARHRPRPVRRPVHHAGIQFNLALFVRQPAVAHGVIVRIIFDHSDSSNHCVQRVPALLQNIHPFIQRMQSVRAGNNQWPLPLPSRSEIRKSRQSAAVRMRGSEQFARACNRASRKRTQKKFTP